MSKDIKHKIRLVLPDYHPESPAYNDVWIDDVEYKDMLRSLRSTDDAKSVWIRDLEGKYRNMSLVQYFMLMESEEIK